MPGGGVRRAGADPRRAGGGGAAAGVSEYAVAGARIGRPIDVVPGKVTSLPLPADAELVFEGHMPPPEVETQPEGPFGEWPGYFSSNGPQPVIRVQAVYHRHDAIIIGQGGTKPNYPGRQVKIASLAAMWDALEAAGVPEVRGVWNLLGGGYRFIQVISIKQVHAGHAKMAGLVAAGCGASYMARIIIVVDDDVDITNPAEVMWAVSTRWDPRTQTDIIDNCWTGHIDPVLPPEKRERDDITHSRIIIYAVRPFQWKDEFPAVNAIGRDYAEAIRRKWGEALPFLKAAAAPRAASQCAYFVAISSFAYARMSGLTSTLSRMMRVTSCQVRGSRTCSVLTRLL